MQSDLPVSNVRSQCVSAPETPHLEFLETYKNPLYAPLIANSLPLHNTCTPDAVVRHDCNTGS